jgi:protein-tyrosine phosphatase
MVDLHSHVLPGIDDGPASVEGSLAIARRAVEDGTVTLLATPHVSSRHPNDAATIAGALEDVRVRLREEGVTLELLPGAEIAITHVAEMDPAELPALGLGGGGGWLLLEPPFNPVATGLDASVRRLMRAGHRIVLAHPERCPAFHRDPSIVEELVADGVLTSLTAGSLVGRFGGQARRFALQLLDDGLAHNVASDAHDALQRPPSIAAEIRAAGFGPLERWLTDEVPRAILADAEIPARPDVVGRRSRWSWRRRRSA